MRIRNLLFPLMLCTFLLTACGGAAAPPAEDPPPPAAAEEETCGPGVPYGITCRIVDGAGTGTLLLAAAVTEGELLTPAETASPVYTLSLADQVKWKLEEPLRNGQLLRISYRSLPETYPPQLSDIAAVEVPDYGFDDRCVMYLRVLEELWEKDAGLNDGLVHIGVDLSATSLSAAEQSAVAWAFASRHGAQPLTGTLDQLTEQGYITATPLGTSGSGAHLNQPEHFFREWEDGCFFSITEQPMDGVYHGLVPVTFDAMKWRSSLGAYFFADCTSVQSGSGVWADYQIGSQMIS